MDTREFKQDVPTEEIRSAILEVIDNNRQTFWGDLYTALINRYRVEEIRLNLNSLVQDETIRMKEDDSEHDWEYLRTSK